MQTSRGRGAVIAFVGLALVCGSFGLQQIDPDQTGGRLGLSAGLLGVVCAVAGAAFFAVGVFMVLRNKQK